MSAGRRFTLLVNPSAGGGRTLELLPRVVVAMRQRGLEHRVVTTEGLEHGCREALLAARAEEVPVVISGDGLIGQIGGALAGAQVPMGIVPGGRGNDLARVLGIPTDPEGAVDVLATGAERSIDVGEVNDKRFLGVASCGFDSEANRIANEARLVRGRLVYLYAALRALIAWTPARFALTLDGEQRELVGFAVAAANSKAYGGGMYIAPDARLDDGLLDIVCTGEMTKLRALVNLPKLFDGSHIDEDAVSVSRAAELRIDADRPFAVYADGDHLADLPATVRVLPGALRMIAPSP